MAHLRCDFFSDSLGLSTSMTVILPQPTTTQIGLAGAAGDEPPPVLYLLHGLSDDDTIWLRRTSIERYVAPLGLAVVMPQVHRSFYADQAYGGRYWTFLSAELPALVARFFRVSPRRADTFVAGLSMGGFGAFKWALNQPDRFAAAASLSGALTMPVDGRTPEREDDPRLAERIWGAPKAPTGGPDDLRTVLTATPVHRLPALRISCGTEDFLIDENLAFAATCATAGVPVTTRFVPGDHDWAVWDEDIQHVLDWLPLPSRPVG